MNIDIPLPDDLTELTVEEAVNAMAAIEVALQDLTNTLNALRVVATVQTRVEETVAEFLDLRDGVLPNPATATTDDFPAYRQPSGAFDAYPVGRVIRDGSQLWQARRSGVAHSPADAPEEWQQVWLTEGTLSTTPPVDPDTGEPEWPAWDAFTSYRRSGDDVLKVTHEGRLWELIHTHADPGWEPGTLPSVWSDLGPVAPSDAGEPDSVPDQTSINGWVQPTGAHDAYPAAAVVMWNGKTWISQLDGNIWEPGVYGWAVTP